MSGSNSKNVSFIVLLLFVVAVTFTYVIISNNIDETLYTDVSATKIGE